MASSSSFSNDTTTTSSSSSLPQILTPTALPTLIGHLDAGDVLECYAVTRMAPLHFLGNSTSLQVEKSVIALRYPAPLGSSKAPLELTLEYGPQRMGSTLNQEAMPLLQQQEEYVTWENEGHVYYSTSFETRDWTKANYVASLTGAVFELLLEKALEFAQVHRRYQPVRVISADSNDVWLRSSASHDFVYAVWQGLATAGVELQPIMVPPVHLLRLHASSIVKVSGTDPEGRAVSREAYEFYNKLYQCATAIQTGNYQEWEPTGAPSQSPVPTMTPSLTTRTATDVPTNMETKATTESPTTTSVGKKKNSTTTDSPSLAPSVVAEDRDETQTDFPTATPTKLKKWKTKKNKVANNATEQGNDTIVHEDEPPDNNDDTNTNDDDDDSPRRQLDGTMEIVPDESDALDEHDANPVIDDAADYADHENATLLLSVAPTTSPEEQEQEESLDETTKAKEAAQHAKEAADKAKEAAQSPLESKAADAAVEAANAAQAAADATSNAATKAAMEAFKSGDGTLVTTVLRECFEDPKYGIAKSRTKTNTRKNQEETDNVGDIVNNETVVTETFAYLYLDGSNYYRVNLTWPYMDVATWERPLPQPPFGRDSGKVDAVDWLLALLVICLVAATISALLQQMGYNIALLEYQKWFFSPRHYDEEKSRDPTLDVSHNNGQGFSHGFGEDVIPLSMGGRRPFVDQPHDDSDESGDVTAPGGMINGSKDHLDSGELGDLEMVPPQPPTNTLGSPSSSSRTNRATSRSSGGSIGMDFMDETSGERTAVPRRFSRDPDLVDLPDLTSSSKVAIPVSRSSSAGGYTDSIQ